VELTLAELASQAIFAETGQNLFDMSHMFLESIRENEDVIQVDDAEDIEEITEAVVSISLKGCGSVGETEGHDEIFEVTITSTEGGLVFIAVCNPELVICVGHIQARKSISAFEAIEELRNEWEGVTVLDGDIVELSIIDAETEGTIRLFDEEDRGAKG